MKKTQHQQKQKQKQIIKDFNYMSCKASNKAIRMWYDHEIKCLELKKNNKDFNKIQYEKETYGKTYKKMLER